MINYKPAMPLLFLGTYLPTYIFEPMLKAVAEALA